MSSDLNYTFLEKKLSLPSYEVVAEVLQKELSANFEDAKVEVVECPDLTEAPFHLSSNGLGGSPTLFSCGGVHCVAPKLQKERIYDLTAFPHLIGLDSASFIGTGLTSNNHFNSLLETTIDVFVKDRKIQRVGTKALRIDKTTKKHVLEPPEHESQCVALSDIYCSEGKKSKVLKIHCKRRTTTDSFQFVIQTALMNSFKDQCIGLGGTFLVKEGRALCHALRLSLDYKRLKSTTFPQLVEEGATLIEMSAPLVAVGEIVSQDTENLGLRLQHFHCLSSHGDGGHFHYDTAPELVEYVGYFALAEKLIRIDKT